MCGIAAGGVRRVAEAIVDELRPRAHDRLRLRVGWTQHTVGAQYIRTAAILQLLLGNIGRPGGGILALRGHASIQGSTDIPTLFNLLPGYLPMPYAHEHDGPATTTWPSAAGDTGFWGNKRAYMVSLLKAWWGDAATADNDFCFDYLPRLTGDHSHYHDRDGPDRRQGQGLLPAWARTRPSARPNGRLQRQGLPRLDWLVVRDFTLIETAAFWKDGPGDRDRRDRPGGHRHRGFFLPAAAHIEKDGTFTNTQRLLQWHHKAVDPPGDAAATCGSCTTSGWRIRERLAGSTDPNDRPLLDLTWDYPVDGPHDEPVGGGGARARSTATTPTGKAAAGLHRAQGRRLDRLRLLDLLRALRRRGQPDRAPQAGQRADWVAPEWGWAWPANRRILYNRASADPEGRPWSERKAYVWWDADEGEWTGHDVPDFETDKPPATAPPEDAEAQDALGGDRPVHHAGRRQGLAVRADRARSTGRCRRTTSRRSRRSATRSTASSANPARQV